VRSCDGGHAALSNNYGEHLAWSSGGTCTTQVADQYLVWVNLDISFVDITIVYIDEK
jgi:hypothetical protein